MSVSKSESRIPVLKCWIRCKSFKYSCKLSHSFKSRSFVRSKIIALLAISSITFFDWVQNRIVLKYRSTLNNTRLTDDSGRQCYQTILTGEQTSPKKLHISLYSICDFLFLTQRENIKFQNIVLHLLFSIKLNVLRL